MEKLSDGVHNFFEAVKHRALVYGSIDDNFSINELLEQVESFISVHTHAVLCPRFVNLPDMLQFIFRIDDESLNFSLQDRIRSLYWVTQGFFDTVLDHESQLVTFLQLL
jgi:hypothetical protein